MALNVGRRLNDATDAAIAAVAAAWNPVAPDEVLKLYGQDIVLTPDDADVIQGRKVFVFPVAAAAADQFDRADLLTPYTLGAVVVERYTDAGVPLDEWVRERVEWVGATVFATLRNPGLVLAGTMRPAFDGEPAGSIDEVYDLALLTTKKAFWSSMTFRYVELSDY